MSMAQICVADNCYLGDRCQWCSSYYNLTCTGYSSVYCKTCDVNQNIVPGWCSRSHYGCTTGDCFADWLENPIEPDQSIPPFIQIHNDPVVPSQVKMFKLAAENPIPAIWYYTFQRQVCEIPSGCNYWDTSLSALPEVDLPYSNDHKQLENTRQSHPKSAYDFLNYITFIDLNRNINWDNTIPFKISFVLTCNDNFGKQFSKQFRIQVKCKPDSKIIGNPPEDGADGVADNVVQVTQIIRQNIIPCVGFSEFLSNVGEENCINQYKVMSTSKDFSLLQKGTNILTYSQVDGYDAIEDDPFNPTDQTFFEIFGTDPLDNEAIYKRGGIIGYNGKYEVCLKDQVNSNIYNDATLYTPIEFDVIAQSDPNTGWNHPYTKQIKFVLNLICDVDSARFQAPVPALTDYSFEYHGFHPSSFDQSIVQDIQTSKTTYGFKIKKFLTTGCPIQEYKIVELDGITQHAIIQLADNIITTLDPNQYLWANILDKSKTAEYNFKILISAQGGYQQLFPTLGNYKLRVQFDCQDTEYFILTQNKAFVNPQTIEYEKLGPDVVVATSYLSFFSYPSYPGIDCPVPILNCKFMTSGNCRVPIVVFQDVFFTDGANFGISANKTNYYGYEENFCLSCDIMPQFGIVPDFKYTYDNITVKANHNCSAIPMIKTESQQKKYTEVVQKQNVYEEIRIYISTYKSTRPQLCQINTSVSMNSTEGKMEGITLYDSHNGTYFTALDPTLSGDYTFTVQYSTDSIVFAASQEYKLTIVQNYCETVKAKLKESFKPFEYKLNQYYDKIIIEDTSVFFETIDSECPIKLYQISKVENQDGSVVPIQDQVEMDESVTPLHKLMTINPTSGQLLIFNFDRPQIFKIYVQATTGIKRNNIWSDDSKFIGTLEINTPLKNSTIKVVQKIKEEKVKKVKKVEKYQCQFNPNNIFNNATIEDISEFGVIKIKLDKFLNQNNLINLNESNIYITLETHNEYDLDDEFNLQLQNFTWNGTSYDLYKINKTLQNNTIEIQMNFFNPLQVSEGKTYDDIIITYTNQVNQIDFLDQNDSKKLNYCPTILKHSIPRQILNTEFTQNILLIVKSTQTVVKGLTGSQLCLRYLTAGLLGYLFKMVEPLQMIIHMPLFQVQFPANTLSIFGDIVPIVNFDILGEMKFYIQFLKVLSQNYQVKELKNGTARVLQEGEVTPDIQIDITPPDQIVSLDYDSFDPFINLGTILLVIFVYLFILIVTFVILWPLSKCGFFKERYKSLKKILFFDFFFGFCFETYFPIVCVSMLLLNAPEEAQDYHLKTVMFSWCLYLSCAVLIPLILVYVALQTQEVLDSKEFEYTFGSLFIDFRKDTKGQILYRLWFCFRRITFLTTALYMVGLESIQLIILCYFNLANTIYIQKAKPRITLFERRVDTFNEFFFSLISYGLIFLTDLNSTVEQKNNVGWCLVGFSGIILGINGLIMIAISIKSIFLCCVKQYRVISAYFKNKDNISDEQVVEDFQSQAPILNILQIESQQNQNDIAQNQRIVQESGNTQIIFIYDQEEGRMINQSISQIIDQQEQKLVRQMKELFIKRRQHEMKNLNIDLVITHYFQNIIIPLTFFKAEIMRIYYFHSYLDYFRQKFKKIVQKKDDSQTVLEKIAVYEKKVYGQLNNNIFVSGADVKYTIEEINVILNYEYKMLKYETEYKDFKFNRPKSFHFFRIQYKDAHAIIAEKINIQTLDESEVIQKLDQSEINQLENLFGGTAKQFIMRITNMDAQSRKRELVQLYEANTESDKKYVTNVILFFYEILEEHLNLKNEELLVLENKRILMEKRFYENTGYENKICIRLIQMFWNLEASKVVIYQ